MRRSWWGMIGLRGILVWGGSEMVWWYGGGDVGYDNLLNLSLCLWLFV